MECGGLGCTQLRSDGFGLRLSLSELGWDWLALCLCRFGWGWLGRGAAYRLSSTQDSRSFWLKSRAWWQQTSHQGRGWLASPTTRQPASHPADHKQAATYHSAQFCCYSYRVTVCITAVRRGRRVWVIEPRRDSQTSEADVVSCWLVHSHFRRDAICPDSQEGKPWSETESGETRFHRFLHNSATSDTLTKPVSS